MPERIFIGVAWPYANGPLHLGHLAGCYLAADIFARFNRLIGNDVLMVSGSDSHGTPITIRADQENVDPKEIAERRMKEMASASKSAESDLSPLYKSKPIDYLETLTVKDMEIFSQVIAMCERADSSIDVIASILPSEMPRNVCRAFSDASGRGVKVKMLFPRKETNLDLSRLEGFFEIRLSPSMPPAGIILIDEKEFCVGGLDVPDSSNMLLGMWMNQPELARLAKLIFDNIYDSSDVYES